MFRRMMVHDDLLALLQSVPRFADLDSSTFLTPFLQFVSMDKMSFRHGMMFGHLVLVMMWRRRIFVHPADFVQCWCQRKRVGCFSWSWRVEKTVRFVWTEVISTWIASDCRWFEKENWTQEGQLHRSQLFGERMQLLVDRLRVATFINSAKTMSSLLPEINDTEPILVSLTTINML